MREVEERERSVVKGCYHERFGFVEWWTCEEARKTPMGEISQYDWRTDQYVSDRKQLSSHRMLGGAT